MGFTGMFDIRQKPSYDLMKQLEPPDCHYLNAAQGWFELGNPAEATLELAQIGARYQTHPEVLRIQWEILAAQKKWSEALKAAQTYTQTHPNDPDGHIKHANTLYFLGRTKEARDMALALLQRFPRHPGFLYNLACYECQMGNLKEAKEWLDKACQMGAHLHAFALRDPDLEPLRKKIKL